MSRTGEETLTAAPPRAYAGIRVSPDGTRVVAAIFDEENTDVWIWRREQGPLTRFTFDESPDAFSLWTPDSTRVVFYSARDGGGLFWKAADGTGEVERLLESTNDPRPSGWSSDGLLIFDQVPGDIGVLTIEGDRTVEMLLETEFIEQVPALSPDGRWLAYQSDESGQSEIYVRIASPPRLAKAAWTSELCRQARSLTSGDPCRRSASRYVASSYGVRSCQQRKRIRIHLKASERRAA